MLRRKKGLISVGIVFILSILVTNEVHAQRNLDLVIQLEKKQKDLLNKYKDFGDFAKFIKKRDIVDTLICYDLMSTASGCIIVARVSAKLLHIYYLVNEEKNKELVARIIMDEFKQYVKELDFSIQSINVSLTLTEIPVVVTTANQLKDDIREVKELLNSVKLP